MKQLIAAVICALFALSTAYAQQPQGEAKKALPLPRKRLSKPRRSPAKPRRNSRSA